MQTASSPETTALRRFNRGYTQLLGLLRPGGLYAPHSLPEARLIYEVASAPGVSAKTVAETLELDPGYLSRLVAALRTKGIVEQRPDPADGRRMNLHLTPEGEGVFAELDARSEAQMAAVLAALHPVDRAEAASALTVAEALWRTTPAPIELRDPAPGDLGWMIERHGAIYAAEYGFGPGAEAITAEICAKFIHTQDPACEKCWIAWRAGRRLGSIMLVREDETTARLRLFLVEPHARGLGIGSRLVRECLGFARACGYRRVILWTQSVLVDARRVYQNAGFQLISEEQHTLFGPELTGQTWELEL